MAAKVVVRRLRAGDVELVACAMRSADRDEAALFALSPHDGLTLSVKASTEVWCVDVDGVPAGIFGLGRTAGPQSAPWLLTTDAFTHAAFAVARRAKRIVAEWSRTAMLENWCDARNTTALRFLRYLGFIVEPIHGRTQVRFYLPQAVR